MTNRRRQLPPDSPESAQRRATLAQSWWSPTDVMTRLGVDLGRLDEWRKRRLVLAVWHGSERQYLYPPFQFSNDGPLREMAPLLGYLNQGISTSGWEEIEWLCAPHALLDAQSPADVLPHDPIRVLGAAHQEFIQDPDAGW